MAGMPFINKHPREDCVLSLLDLPIIVLSGKIWFGHWSVCSTVELVIQIWQLNISIRTLYLTYWSSWLSLVIGVIPVNQRPLVRDGHSIRLINGHLVLCVVSLDITGRRFIYIVLVHPAAIGYQLNLLTLG